MWDVSENSPVASFEAEITNLRFDPNGTLLDTVMVEIFNDVGMIVETLHLSCDQLTNLCQGATDPASAALVDQAGYEFQISVWEHQMPGDQGMMVGSRWDDFAIPTSSDEFEIRMVHVDLIANAHAVRVDIDGFHLGRYTTTIDIRSREVDQWGLFLVDVSGEMTCTADPNRMGRANCAITIGADGMDIQATLNTGAYYDYTLTVWDGNAIVDDDENYFAAP
jgi:hypothetical protein